MRIHTDLDLDADFELLRAARAAGVAILGSSLHGSRKRRRAYEVSLTGSSPYKTQANRDFNAATWDEWGNFLARSPGTTTA